MCRKILVSPNKNAMRKNCCLFFDIPRTCVNKVVFAVPRQRGGLKNLGNTCFMAAAVQVFMKGLLSPPLNFEL